MLASNASTRTKYFELGSRKTARPVVLGLVGALSGRMTAALRRIIG